MALPRLEGLLQRFIRYSAEGKWFLSVCMALAFSGTVGATYPITAVVVPAVLLVPRRWLQITLVTALGSALGATVLVISFHHLGWAQLYERFPELITHAAWGRIMAWVSSYGTVALFLVAVSPLPQTPALIFFGITRQDTFSVLIVMLVGKSLKYGLFAWLAARFPERFSNGLRAILHRERQTTGMRKDSS